jgi:hydrogenase nickel incorporation protein HypA/HybF
MHELSLMSDVVRLVTEDAARRATPIGRISRVEMEVGELSGAFPHALRAAFPIACKGTALEGAELVINEVRADVRCKKCGREFLPTKDGWACPACGSYEADLRHGTELQVVSYTGEEEECPSRSS